MTKLLHLFLLAYSLPAHGSPTGEKEEQYGRVVLCYYAEWAVYRTSPGDFFVNNVDPKLCTHFVYAYIGMNETTFKVQSRDPETDFKRSGTGMISEAVALKDKNPDLKVMVSCGGWSEGSIRYSRMASSPSTRKIFIDSVVKFLRDHKFDGFDLAWEYPSARGGGFDDRENFATLLEELRAELDKGDYLLTVQLMGKKTVIEPGYDVPRISKAVHYISLVTYNMNTPQGRITGINSPLDSDDEKNVKFALSYILKKGASPNKILLGFATYGHQYIMNEDVTDDKYVGVPANKTYPGPWSHEDGFIGYNEVCYGLTLEKSNWIEMWEEESSTPFAVKGRKFVSYDNRKSYRKKLKLVKRKGLAGAMVWSIDTDDFKGLCYGKRYPLINTIKDFLSGEEEEETEAADGESNIPKEFIRGEFSGRKSQSCTEEEVKEVEETN